MFRLLHSADWQPGARLAQFGATPSYLRGPQVSILDDVLVNTDPVRQDLIFDVLGAQADRLQILILTCHPDRDRGIGRPITFTA